MTVILYSTNCPRCRVLESKLKSASVTFDVCTDVDLMIAKGYTAAPTLEVDGESLSFNEAVKWANERIK